MVKRKNARELALKVIFQVDVGQLPLDEVLETSLAEVAPPADDWEYVSRVVTGAVRELGSLDAIIDDLAEGWRLERLARVDKNVLRIALYEMQYERDQPANVIINDAVEIAKKYSTEDSGRFVNGILGSFLRRQSPATGSAPQAETEAVTTPETGAAVAEMGR